MAFAREQGIEVKVGPSKRDRLTGERWLEVLPEGFSELDLYQSQFDY